MHNVLIPFQVNQQLKSVAAKAYKSIRNNFSGEKIFSKIKFSKKEKNVEVHSRFDEALEISIKKCLKKLIFFEIQIVKNRLLSKPCNSMQFFYIPMSIKYMPETL